jgi:hypothetical protein
MHMTDKIAVENINTPGRTTNVDKAKYDAMKNAMLAILPHGAPGLTAKDTKDALLPHLPETLFPAGVTAGWWMKCVQLDLEAKGTVMRENSKPLRFYQT